MKKLIISFLFALVVSFGYAQNMPNYWVPSSGTDTYTTGIPSWTGATYNNKVGFVQFANTNTGASTINVNSFGAAALRKWSGSAWVALSAGDIKTNTTYKISYDNTNTYFMIEGGNLGGSSGGSTWGSITGTLSSQTDLQTAIDAKVDKLTAGRTITTADDTDQSDNKANLLLNGTFNLTLDALSQWTEFGLINIGSGTVTIVDGSGVTHTGESTIEAGNTAYVYYETSTAPRVLAGGAGTGDLIVGTSAITSGTDTRILYDNAGVLGEYAISGTGSVAMTNSPVFTTPNIGTATGSITGNAATVTTNANLTGDVTSTGNATSIASGVIVNADVNASAAIAGSKLANTPAGSIAATTVQTAIDELDSEKQADLPTGSAFDEFRWNSGNAAIEAFTPISYPLTSIGDILQGTTAGAPARLAAVSDGSFLRSFGTVTPVAWSATKWPNAATVNQILYATATDTYGGSSSLTFNGTRLSPNYITLAAGSTSNAPLRFTSGSLATGGNIVAGNVEFLTDKWYATITTGTAVKELTLNDAALTSGTFPVATTNGRLTNSTMTSTNLVAGTYTPTLTNTANLDASTANQCTYMRVGNTVTVSGQISVDPTTTLTLTTLGISLPVASALTTANQAGGTAAAISVADNPAGIFSDATNDRVTLQYICVDVTNHTMAFTFTYQVL